MESGGLTAPKSCGVRAASDRVEVLQARAVPDRAEVLRERVPERAGVLPGARGARPPTDFLRERETARLAQP
jgi:hypothetical protein